MATTTLPPTARFLKLTTAPWNLPHLPTVRWSSPLNIRYQLERELSTQEFLDVLRRSTLSQRRPVDQPERIGDMLRNADVIVTARAEKLLVGIARAISDFSYCTYLSDLAVDVGFQRQGIGRELIRRAHQAGGLDTTLILLAAPAAANYYPHIGMSKHESCWIVPAATTNRNR